MVSITDEELKSFAEAIRKRHGIDFTHYEPVSFKRRVSRAISIFNLDSIFGLWKMMLVDQTFIYKIMDELSVGLTTMFRDPILWIKLRKEIEEQIRNKNSISIWHSGCSSGEEVFSMGILLQEMEVQTIASAFATDISLQAINRAKSGTYDIDKLSDFKDNYSRYNPKGNFEKFYQAQQGEIVLDKSLIRHVDFAYHHLLTNMTPGKYDIIFCRNVMIYFDTDTKVELIRKYHQALNPGGLFIVGFYDAIASLVDPALFSVVDAEAKIYRANDLVYA